MDQDASLLEAGLLVGGGHLVAHPQLHLGRAEFEAGDDGCVVRQLSFCQQCGSCNALVLNFNWNMEGVSNALAVFCFLPSEKKKLGLPTQGWGPPLKRRVLEAPGGRTVTGNPSEFGPDSFVVGCTTSRLLDSWVMIDKDVQGHGFYPLGNGYDL